MFLESNESNETFVVPTMSSDVSRFGLRSKRRNTDTVVILLNLNHVYIHATHRILSSSSSSSLWSSCRIVVGVVVATVVVFYVLVRACVCVRSQCISVFVRVKPTHIHLYVHRHTYLDIIHSVDDSHIPKQPRESPYHARQRTGTRTHTFSSNPDGTLAHQHLRGRCGGEPPEEVSILALLSDHRGATQVTPFVRSLSATAHRQI